MIEQPYVIITNKNTETIFQGWKSISITYELGKYSGEFTLSAIDSPSLLVDETNKPIEWQPDSQVVIRSDPNPGIYESDTNDLENTLMVGRLDSYSTGFSGSGTNTTLNGRSLPAIIEDTFPERNELEFKNSRISSYIRKVLNDYKIDHENFGTSTEIPAHDRFDLFVTVGKNLSRALRSLSETLVVPVGNFEGGVNFFYNRNLRNARIRTNFIDKNYVINNIKSINYNVNEKNRFYKYEASGQAEISASDTSGNVSNKQFVTVRDNNQTFGDGRILRDRLLRKKVPGDYDRNQMLGYANYMKNHAYGFSRRMTMVVTGWRHNNGDFFAPGQVIKTEGRLAERVGVLNNDWVILKTQFSLQNSETVSINSGGTITAITCVKKESFSKEPNIEANEGIPGLVSRQQNNNDDAEN